jgi:hypothetical protein
LLTGDRKCIRCSFDLLGHGVGRRHGAGAAQTPTNLVPATHLPLGVAPRFQALTAAASGAASSPGKPVSYSETTWISAPIPGSGWAPAGQKSPRLIPVARESPEGFHRLAHTILEATVSPTAGDLHSKTDD